MKTIEIKGSFRNEVGKKSTREIRKTGNVPCIIYGKENNINFSTQESSFKNLVYTHEAHLVNIDIEGNDELSLVTREALFRITQEALANIARHSSAKCADVSLEYETDIVKMIIKDNGHGFDKSVQHGGLGLYSMRERAEVLGGRFTVESSLEQGTKIVVTLPQRA